MKLIHEKTNHTVLTNLAEAKDALSRMKGLLFTKELKKGHGLWLKPCNSIHMFGMRYSIDAIFLDKEYRVVKMLEDLKPNRVSPLVFGADSVIEMPAGSLSELRIEPLDQMKVLAA